MLLVENSDVSGFLAEESALAETELGAVSSTKDKDLSRVRCDLGKREMLNDALPVAGSVVLI